jgi:arylsulfatase A-like enzyme
VKGFVQLTDVFPTILGRLNLKPPSRVTGEDLWPYILDHKRNQREHVVQGFGWIAAVRTAEWNYSAIWNREKYTGEYAAQLYDTRKDPQELKNVASEHREVVKDLQRSLGGTSLRAGKSSGDLL